MSEEDLEARALEHSEQRFRALAEAAREAILINENGIIREVNSALTRLLGYSREELLGKSGVDLLLAPESRAAVRESIRSSGSGGTSDIVLITKSGERRVVDTTSQPIMYQGRPMRVVTMQDLTARRAAEAARRESDERLRSALRAARMGSWEWQIEPDTVAWSPEMFAIFGISEAGFDGRLESYLALVHPDDRARVQQVIESCVHGPCFEVTFEHRVSSADGKPKWVENRGQAFRNAHGTPSHMTGTSMDITRRHELEQQLLHSQRLEATGRLASGVAHDFNNLLTVIMNYSELGRFGLKPAEPAFEALEQINLAAQRAAALTRQLLIFARKEVAHPKVVDLNHLIESTERLLQRMVGEDIVVASARCSGAALVIIDPAQCEQLLINLAVNARDAMPRGGTLTLRTLRLGETVHLQVQDTGCGMAVHVQERAFEPFFTTKDVGKGTGLGLSTCLDVVRAAGGRISIQSKPGEGTLFDIEFPRAKRELQADLADEPSLMPRGAETVLLIEDDAVVRQLTARILKRQGYDVLVATRASEALQLAASHRGQIDLFLSDVVMPGESGPSVVERLLALRPTAKVLFVSGYPGEDISRRGVDQSSYHFLAKPYSSEQLAQRVREVLDA